jgi:hypothetical protein
MTATAERPRLKRLGHPMGGGARGLPHRLGERYQIVLRGRRRLELPVVAHQIPAAWGGQTPGVLLAQVVRMRLGERGERSDHRGRLGIDVGQRRNR